MGPEAFDSDGSPNVIIRECYKSIRVRVYMGMYQTQTLYVRASRYEQMDTKLCATELQHTWRKSMTKKQRYCNTNVEDLISI